MIIGKQVKLNYISGDDTIGVFFMGDSLINFDGYFHVFRDSQPEIHFHWCKKGYLPSMLEWLDKHGLGVSGYPSGIAGEHFSVYYLPDDSIFERLLELTVI